MRTKYIFITGGVLSSLGKGLAAALDRTLGTLADAWRSALPPREFEPIYGTVQLKAGQDARPVSDAIWVRVREGDVKYGEHISGSHGPGSLLYVRRQDWLVVETDCDEVRRHRKTALELLLSDHLGDCVAPCENVCPAHLDIPRMNRLIAEGKMREAAEVVKETIPLPAVLGRICPTPCEARCRRKPLLGCLKCAGWA